MSQLDWFIRNELKPKHLRLLIALDELKNIGKVATHIHVTQPAVSKALAELEKGLEAKLFERTPRGVIPTVYGECLIRHARVLLSSLNEAREEMNGLVAGASGYLCVGALANVVPILLPQSIALLKRRLPGTNVLLHEGTMGRLLPQVLLGQLDLVVGRVTEMTQTHELGVKILSEERLVPIVAPHHPLAGRSDLEWSDLKKHTWVLPPVDGLLRELLECTLESHNMAMPNDYVEALSVHFVLAYLQHSNAIATITREIAEYYQQLGKVVILDFDFPKIVRVLALAWNRQRPLSRSTIELIDCMEEVIRAPVTVTA